MKTRKAVAAGLVVFVLVSIVYLVAGALLSPGPNKNNPSPVQASAEREDQAPSNQIVAYYFHGDVRCDTCRALEAYAHDALVEGFPEAMREGQLLWRTVNVDQPGNAHYVDDYQLWTRSLVLIQLRGGRQVKWKNLEAIWDLVGERERYVEYVQGEIRAMLGEVEG
jgi:hypothetical protein